MVQPWIHYASQGLGPGTWCNQGCIMHPWALAHGATGDALCIPGLGAWYMVQPWMHYASLGLGPDTWCNQGCIMHPWALAHGATGDAS